MVIDRDHLNRILIILKQYQNFDIGGCRIETITRGISHRIKQTRAKDICGYIELLDKNSRECNLLVNSIAVSYSIFFRDPGVFNMVEQILLPEIIKRKLELPKREIRAWSAGCASGEEAYSLAILLHKLTNFYKNWHCGIFATDIDNMAIARAKAGCYQREALENVRVGILDKYFRQQGDSYYLKSFIRDMVSFSHNDLTSENTLFPTNSIFGDFDLLLCRNVLIYFNSNVQAAIIEKLIRALASDGFLLLGIDESPGESDELELVDFQQHIYRKRENM